MTDAAPGTAADAPATLRLTWVVVLRGFAALWVYAFHLWMAMGGVAVTFGFAGGFTYGLRSLFHAGYQGIDLFFVLSGFVIAWPFLQHRQQRMDRYQVVDFYQRRYLRIAPIYYASIVVVVVLIHLQWILGTRSVGAIAAHLLFLQNFVPDWVVVLRGVYWTLPTEIHFYLLFPLLLRCIDIDRPWRFAVACLAFAMFYRWFAAHAIVAGMGLSWTAAYLPGRIDQFACGMAAAAILARRSAGPPVTLASVWAAGLLAVVGLVWLARHEGPLDGWFVVAPGVAGVLIAVFIVALGRHAQARGHVTAAPHTWLTRAAARLGEASLGIYLWHTVFIDLAVQFARGHAIWGRPFQLLLLATIPVTIAVSLCTWRVIESPAIAFARSPRWRARVRRCVDRLLPAGRPLPF